MPSRSWIEVPIDQYVEGVPTSGYDPFNFPAEGAKLVFEFTQEGFLKVLSALINGAALTYPEDWIQVVWYFLKNVEYPVSLCDEIAAAILTCEDVQLALASVIGTPGPVQDAISDLVVQSPEINTYISQIVKGLNPGQITGPLIAGSCDNSVLAGKMLTLIDRLDENNKDALELIEVGTNDEEKTATILEGIPIADELPIGDIIDFAQDILEDFSENYNGASTIDRREQTAQDLYCLAKSKPDCELTYGDLFDYFQVKAASGLTLGSLIGDIVNFLADGDFDTDDAVFYGMMALQVAAIRTGQEFFGINAPRITALTRDSDPSTIWEEWGDCPDTPTPRYVIVNGLPTYFPEQTETFIEYDGDWDVWDVNSGSSPFAPFSTAGGTFNYGTNFRPISPICLDVESISGLDWQQSLTCPGGVENAATLNGSYQQCGTYSSSPVMLRIRIKPS